MQPVQKKSNRNKTIDIDLEEGKFYLDRCIKFSDAGDTIPFKINEILDKTLCGDTFSVLPLLPSSFADIAVIDPPYNLYKNYGETTFGKLEAEKYRKYTEAWLNLLLPHLKPDASLYVCCDWKSSVQIAEVLTSFQDEKRLFIKNRISWQREKGRGAARNWKNSMEDIWFCTIDKSAYTFNLENVKIRRKVIAPYKKDGQPKDWEKTEQGNFRNTCPGNFWDDISIPYWSMPENTAHPTQKPEKLIAKLILASSSLGDTVLDPFLGSGTTSVTAKKLGRRYCGIEQNPQYCVWAEKRLENAEKDKSIQGFSGGVFYERNTRPVS
ncbi:site-specific DNA-methyltransferase [Treponema parvum]|uniref:Methyltransferase n=1 Tax=Treponema parvum TaxID=138851 RepID=A0A975F268_9SPIR|nr:DNA methyltransferase [Treponema parvum]QTQ13056.1 site-specific DNA-methyltransferase [Treponema parvum]